MTDESVLTPAGAKLIEDFVNTNELDETDGEKLLAPDDLRAWLSEHALLPDGATVDDDDLARAWRGK